MLSQKNQIINRLRQAENILLMGKKNYSGDGLASLLGFYLFLKYLNKNCDIVIDSFSPRLEYKFLPGWNVIKHQLSKLKKFTIAVDISQTKLDDFNYDVKDKELLIYLTPSKGFFNNEDIRLKTTDFKYDLVICLGVQDLESLGNLYHEHADFLYHVPLINIDNHHLNERFGNINEIDITRSSVAEISYDIMQQINSELIDENIATCLLTGLISATRSFKSPTVSPQTLHLASELINLGADRKKIVDQLFNTKSVSTLKLWGRVLARLKSNNKYNIVWSIINQNDFLKSGAQEQDLPGVIKEVIVSSPQAEIVIIFYASTYNKTKVYLYSDRNYNSLQLASPYQPHGDKELATFVINQPIEQVENQILESVISKLKTIIP